MRTRRSEQDPANDPLRDALDAERRAHLEAGESGGAELRDARERERAAHEDAQARAADQVADTEAVEEARILEMRRHGPTSTPRRPPPRTSR